MDKETSQSLVVGTNQFPTLHLRTWTGINPQLGSYQEKINLRGPSRRAPGDVLLLREFGRVGQEFVFVKWYSEGIQY